ncbi:hypothetical protein FAUST_79 [Fusarium austroamericanum]|uniref:Actin-like ATPase domain-containing protein n=1 Tax=Fusarium austroamericanum TaxID=282268 RepID=A0AAN6CAZ1_FUSAU|nr:hypothetical protein FAUST_79 [Fusarium austroamericanum]
MSTNKPTKSFIVIGIDFGTTNFARYSGIAWASSREPENIQVITEWKTEISHRSNTKKVPTELFYSSGSDTSWGYSVPADKDALKWFKLLLIDEKDMPAKITNCSQFQRSRELLETMKKGPIDAIACFLSKIWSHAMDKIESKLGKELVQNSEFQVVVTLPAIWPPYARYRMEQAVEVSGIRSPRPCGNTTVCFISEPQAAALATMHDFRDTSTVKAGDTMVICDAGGGTVDLVNGMVESTVPFVVEEWVEGEGELCGGVFLDEEFLELIKGKVTPGSWPSVSIAEQNKLLDKEWEHGIKPQFSNQNRTWQVNLPDSCSGPTSGRNLKRRKAISISSDEIWSVYNPIISKIEALIDHQINAVQKKCRRTTIETNRNWTAICRGAVIYGINGHGPEASLGPEIDTRVALRSYGVLSDTLFRPDEHIGCEKYWSEDDQVWKVNKMEWFIREGETLLTKKTLRQDFLRLCSGGIDKMQNLFYSCTESPPPKVWDSSMEPLCAIQWTGDINIESLPTQTTPLGKVLRKVVYVIEMNYEDGWADFTIYSQGMRVGAHHVNVELR